MPAETAFAELIDRARANDEAAWTEILRRYGETLLGFAQVRLIRMGLRYDLGPSDIVNSIMGDFFVELSRKTFTLKNPADLQKLLMTLVKRKVIYHRRKMEADIRKPDGQKVELVQEPADSDPTPFEEVVAREEFQKVWERLDADQQQLALLVEWEDLAWSEVGARLGISAEAARRRFERMIAVQRQRWQKGGRHE